MARAQIELTAEQKNGLVALYRHNFEDDAVAEFFGFRTKSLQRYLKKKENLELRHQIKQAKIVARLAMRQKLYDIGATEGKLEAIKYWLQNCDDEWRDVVSHEVSGPGKKPMEFQPHEMTKAQLVNYIVSAIADGQVNLKGIDIGGANGLDPAKAIAADFEEESRESN